MRGKTRKFRVNLNLFAVLFISFFLVNIGFGATLDSYGTVSGTITILDNVPPEISNVTYLVATPGEPNNRSVIIRWETGEKADSTVEFLEGGSWSVKASNSSFVENHKIKISGLSEGNYTFRVNSSDDEGNSAVSGNYSFTIEKMKEISGHVVINEISLGANNFEWVELYNPTEEDINFSEKVHLVYYSSGRDWNDSYRPAEKKLSGIIPAKGFYLVKIDGNGTTGKPDLEPTPDYDWDYKGDADTLSNSDGTVAIFPFDPDIKNAEVAKTGRIDAVAWGEVNLKEGSSALVPQKNKSIERKLHGYDTDNNSADFVIRETPTPTNSSPQQVQEADIVLNEFLPIAGNYSEFIEFYNKGSGSANMENWTIETNNHNITINESILLAGFENTTIGAEGSDSEWLVIDLSKVGGNLLRENDTITLYDNESREIDKVSYTNATMQDKSYARMPDGEPNWVDPLPTPGKPNKLENQIIGEQINETGGNQTVNQSINNTANQTYNMTNLTSNQTEGNDTNLTENITYNGTNQTNSTCKENQTGNQTEGANETKPRITIISPENKIYNLTEIELIVETRGEIQELWYSLNNEENVSFEANTTINTREETNYLVVYTNTSFGVINEEVYFSVNISGEDLGKGEEDLTNNLTNQSNQTQNNQPDNDTISPDVSNTSNNSVTQGNDSDEINNQSNTPEEMEMVEEDSGEEEPLDDKQEETGESEQVHSSEEELQEETGSEEEGNSDVEKDDKIEDERKTAKVEEEVEGVEMVNNVDPEEETEEYKKEVKEAVGSGGGK